MRSAASRRRSAKGGGGHYDARVNAGNLRRAWAYVFSAALIAAVMWPLFGDAWSDSFPFSTYPMFSGRQSSEVSIAHVVAVDAAGEAEVLPPEALGTDEVIQAFETVRQAIRQGDASVAALCADAADWASDRREDAVSIAVVTDTYDGVAYFDGETEPSASETHATCEVSP
jgi:hypothetical protein